MPMSDTITPEDKSDPQNQNRRKSTVSLEGVLRFNELHDPEELLSPEDQEKQQAIQSFIEKVDRDGDGKIDSEELFLALGDFYEDTVRANEDAIRANTKIRNYKLAIGGLVSVTVLLVGAVFGTSVAAAFLAKDTQVNERALLTKDGQPVGINLNELQVPVASLAFLPPIVASKVDELILSDDEGNMYHRIKQDIDVAPGKSVTVRTTGGDTVSWNAAAESKDNVKIVLANGKAWDQSSCCTACTAVSVVAGESVAAALDNFYATFNDQDQDDKDRRLGNAVRSFKGSEHRRNLEEKPKCGCEPKKK